MGDSGEGLVDSEARIQERMEELQRERENARKAAIENPQVKQQIESLQLARMELVCQLKTTAHAGRKNQLTAALAEIDRRIADLEGQQPPTR